MPRTCKYCRHWSPPPDGDVRDYEHFRLGLARRRVKRPSGVCNRVLMRSGGEDGEVAKPLPDRLVAELTAWRTLALQDAFAQSPSTAFAAVLHVFVLDIFYASRESCLEVSLRKVSFGTAPGGAAR